MNQNYDINNRLNNKQDYNIFLASLRLCEKFIFATHRNRKRRRRSRSKPQGVGDEAEEFQGAAAGVAELMHLVRRHIDHAAGRQGVLPFAFEHHAGASRMKTSCS